MVDKPAYIVLIELFHIFLASLLSTDIKRHGCNVFRRAWAAEISSAA